MRLKYYSLDNLAQSKTCADQNEKKKIKEVPSLFFFPFYCGNLINLHFLGGGGGLDPLL